MPKIQSLKIRRILWKQNNAAYGYERFDYLYLEDTMPEKDRLTQTHQKICEFFKEKA